MILVKRLTSLDKTQQRDQGHEKDTFALSATRPTTIEVSRDTRGIVKASLTLYSILHDYLRPDLQLVSHVAYLKDNMSFVGAPSNQKSLREVEIRFVREIVASKLL